MNTAVERVLGSHTGRAVCVALAYFAAAELGHALSLQTLNQAFATFWPPSGLLLAALVLSRGSMWAAVLSGALAANLTSDVLFHDKSIAVSLGFCVANGLEACIGAWLLRRFVAAPFTLGRVADVVRLGGLSALLSTLIGATIGAGVVAAAFAGSFWAAWMKWWIGDALGILVVAPIMFAWSGPFRPFGSATRRPGIAECVVTLAGVAVMSEGVYGEWLPSPFTVPIFILPFLLWAAMRCGPRSVSTALFVVAIVGMENTAASRGPYVALTPVPSERLLRAQGTLAVIGLSILLLAAVATERRKAIAEIKTLRGLIPICAWCKKVRDDVGYWQQIETYIGDQTGAKFTHGICPECVAKHVESSV